MPTTNGAPSRGTAYRKGDKKKRVRPPSPTEELTTIHFDAKNLKIHWAQNLGAGVSAEKGGGVYRARGAPRLMESCYLRRGVEGSLKRVISYNRVRAAKTWQAKAG